MTKSVMSLLAGVACCIALCASQPSIASAQDKPKPPAAPELPAGHPATPPALPAGHPAPGQPPATGQPPAGHPPMPGSEEVPVLDPDWPVGKPEDVKSVDAIIKAYYASVSGAKGETRDWNRLRSLTLPEVKLFSTRPAGNRSIPIVLTLDQYIDANRKYFERGGYYENEIHRKVDAFGSIAQVFSTYESRRHINDPTPYSRGLNSFQLIFDGERWWIASICWDGETQTRSIPAEYLGAPTAPPVQPAEKK